MRFGAGRAEGTEEGGGGRAERLMRDALAAVNAAHRREAVRECGLRNAVTVVEVAPVPGRREDEAPAPWSPSCAFTLVTVLPSHGVRVVRTELTLTAGELEAFADGRPSRLEEKVRKVARLGGLVEDELLMSDIGDAVLTGPPAAGEGGLRRRVAEAQGLLLDAGFGGPYRLLVAAADPPLPPEDKAVLLAQGIGVGTTRGGIGRLLVAGRPGVEMLLAQDHRATLVAADGRRTKLTVESRWSSRVTRGPGGTVGICRVLDPSATGR